MQKHFLIPYKEDSGVPSYLPFPRFLIPLDLSNDAKVLYALLFDRAGISRENGYIDPNGRIRLYFTVEEAKEKLHRSRQVVTRAFQELERSGLIVRWKQGLGRPAVITLNILPARIYVYQIHLVPKKARRGRWIPWNRS